MKVSDLIPGYVSHFQQLDPEVIRAQRLQELKDVAEWRARRLQAYKDWADPEKREAMKAKVAKEMLDEREKLSGTFIDDYRVRTVRQDRFIDGLSERIKVTPIVKPLPKRKWWQRLLDWIMD